MFRFGYKITTIHVLQFNKTHRSNQSPSGALGTTLELLIASQFAGKEGNYPLERRGTWSIFGNVYPSKGEISAPVKCQASRCKIPNLASLFSPLFARPNVSGSKFKEEIDHQQKATFKYEIEVFHSNLPSLKTRPVQQGLFHAFQKVQLINF